MSNYKLYRKTKKAESSRHIVNEDSYLFTEYIFMNDCRIDIIDLADGMGGLKNGDKASKTAVKTFARVFYELLLEEYLSHDSKHFSINNYADIAEKLIKKSIIAANDEVCKGTEQFEESGTTLSVVVIVNDYAILANVGDSPIYYYDVEEDEFNMVSELHTQAELDAQAGIYPYYSKEYYRNDHLLYRYLGHHEILKEEDIYVQVIGYLEKGDMFLAGSDGAFGRLRKGEIKKILDDESDGNQVLSELFQIAHMDKDDDMTAMLYIVD